MTKQKVVIRVTICDPKKSRTKALQIAATTSGVESVALSGAEKNELVVIGEDIDTVELTKLLRKKLGGADIISVGPEKAAEVKKNEAKVEPLVYYYDYTPYNYSYPLFYRY